MDIGSIKMGKLSAYPTASLIEVIKEFFGVNVAIETGTFEGEGTFFLAKRFPRVITIEILPEYIDKVKNISTHSNIEYILGDSRDILPNVLENLNESAIFWLDAHNTFQYFGSTEDDCPLLEELDAIFDHIEKHYNQHFIFIDDLNSFLPKEEKIDQSEGDLKNWVTISEINEKAKFHGYTSAISWSCNALVLVPDEFIFICAGIYNDDKEQVLRYLKQYKSKAS